MAGAIVWSTRNVRALAENPALQFAVLDLADDDNDERPARNHLEQLTAVAPGEVRGRIVCLRDPPLVAELASAFALVPPADRVHLLAGRSRGPSRSGTSCSPFHLPRSSIIWPKRARSMGRSLRPSPAQVQARPVDRPREVSRDELVHAAGVQHLLERRAGVDAERLEQPRPRIVEDRHARGLGQHGGQDVGPLVGDLEAATEGVGRRTQDAAHRVRVGHVLRRPVPVEPGEAGRHRQHLTQGGFGQGRAHVVRVVGQQLRPASPRVQRCLPHRWRSRPARTRCCSVTDSMSQ